MIGVGWAIFGVQVIPDAFTILLIFLGSLMFSGIGMTLAGIIKDIEAANGVGKRHRFPHDVSLRNLLPVRHDAKLPAGSFKSVAVDVFLRGSQSNDDYKDSRNHMVQLGGRGRARCRFYCGWGNGDAVERKVSIPPLF